MYPCKTMKHGYWFREDDKAFQRYKTIKSNQRYCNDRNDVVHHKLA